MYLLRLKANDFYPYTLPGKTTNQNVYFIYQYVGDIGTYFANKI